jgi:hypothetical protein
MTVLRPEDEVASGVETLVLEPEAVNVGVTFGTGLLLPSRRVSDARMKLLLLAIWVLGLSTRLDVELFAAPGKNCTEVVLLLPLPKAAVMTSVWASVDVRVVANTPLASVAPELAANTLLLPEPDKLTETPGARLP